MNRGRILPVLESLKEENKAYYTKKFGSEIVGNFLGTFSPLERGVQDLAERYEVLLEMFGGDVPTYIQESFVKDPDKDFILENLQTHDSERLQAALKKRYGGDFDCFYLDGPKGCFTWLIPVQWYDRVNRISLAEYVRDAWYNFRKDNTNQEDIIRLVKFYGYNIRNVRCTDDFCERARVFIEPEFPESIETADKEFYCVVGRENADSVSKTGLRVKNGPTWDNTPFGRWKRPPEKQYAYFPKRIYLFSPDKPCGDDKVEVLKSIIPLAHELGKGWVSIAVFKVDMPYSKVYRDPAMPNLEGGEAFFTYNSIPPEKLKRIY